MRSAEDRKKVDEIWNLVKHEHTAVLKRIPVILKHSLRERNSWRIRLGLVVG
jgi:hypothetical protein